MSVECVVFGNQLLEWTDESKKRRRSNTITSRRRVEGRVYNNGNNRMTREHEHAIIQRTYWHRKHKKLHKHEHKPSEVVWTLKWKLWMYILKLFTVYWPALASNIICSHHKTSRYQLVTFTSEVARFIAILLQKFIS